MPVSAESSSSSSSTTIGQHIRLHRPRTHQTTRNLPPFVADDPLVIPKPSRLCKSAMSSFFLLPNSSNETTRKKSNGFPQTASSSSFRGLGCTTASASHQVSVPAVIRSSADWDATNFKIKKTKSKKNKGSYSGGSIKILSEASSSVGGGCATIPDVWCGPGVGFSTDAVVGASADPVESDPQRRNIPTRRKIDGDKNNSSSNNQREGSSLLPRRSLNKETTPYFDTDSSFLSSRAEQTLFSDRYRRHLQQPYPDGLAEMMMMQNGFVMGAALNSHDHFRDLRLNVDNMSYEQLLELGDRIGHVNTGLKEKQIKICLRKVKHLRSDAPLADEECCSICREEYEAKDSVGKLRCGHRFHVDCVKQWLKRKNSCPVCKTTPYVES